MYNATLVIDPDVIRQITSDDPMPLTVSPVRCPMLCELFREPEAGLLTKCGEVSTIVGELPLPLRRGVPPARPPPRPSPQEMESLLRHGQEKLQRGAVTPPPLVLGTRSPIPQHVEQYDDGKYIYDYVLP